MSLRKNANSTANSRWWVPINFATSTNPDFSSTLATHWLSPKTEELVIDGIAPQDWIIVNIQQTGFYRVNYDTTNWLKIADYLDSENYTKIHVLNRARIINDAIHLVFTNKLEPRILMEVTKYLQRETDYVVWYSLFKILRDAISFFDYSGGGELFKSYINELMTAVIMTHLQDWMQNPNDNYFKNLTRYAISDDACALDFSFCLWKARIQLRDYLKNSAVLAKRTSFQRKRWIFCNGVKEAEENIWNELLYMYTNKSEPTLYCLGHSKNQSIIAKFLNMTISEHSPFAKNDIYRVIYSVLNGGFPNIDVVINFVISHWDKLTTVVEDPMYLIHDISWSVVSRKQIQKIKEFLGKLGMEVPQIIKLREQNIELAEIIVNKIRVWLVNKSLNITIN